MFFSSRFQHTFYTFQCSFLTFPSVLPPTVILDPPYNFVSIQHLFPLLRDVTICNTSISLDLFVECVTFRCQMSHVTRYISTHVDNNWILTTNLSNPPKLTSDMQSITLTLPLSKWHLSQHAPKIALQKYPFCRYDVVWAAGVEWKKWNLHMTQQSIQLEMHHANVRQWRVRNTTTLKWCNLLNKDTTINNLGRRCSY